MLMNAAATSRGPYLTDGSTKSVPKLKTNLLVTSIKQIQTISHYHNT